MAMMTRGPIIGLLAACLVLGGCAGGGGSGGTSGETEEVYVGPAAAGPASVSTGAAAGDEAAPRQTVTAPADATATIVCADFTGGDHRAAAERAKQFAEAATLPAEYRDELGEFYVVHGQGRSVLYHGFYSTFDPDEDAEAGLAAQIDRRLIEAMEMAGPGGRFKAFPRAHFTPLKRPDPKAPPEWDLANVDAYWTVCIGTYTDPARRKRAAVESVAEARRMGVEAYYFHDQSQSYVTVGTWPADAARQRLDTDYDPAKDDPNDPQPLIVSTGELPAGARNMTDRRGRRVRSVEMGLEISDPTLRATLERYPYSVDGVPEKEVPLLFPVARVTGRAAPTIDEPAIDPVSQDREMRDLLARPAGL